MTLYEILGCLPRLRLPWTLWSALITYQRFDLLFLALKEHFWPIKLPLKSLPYRSLTWCQQVSDERYADTSATFSYTSDDEDGDSVIPGSQVDINMEASAGSTMLVGIVDSSILLMSTPNDITERYIMSQGFIPEVGHRKNTLPVKVLYVYLMRILPMATRCKSR